MTCAKRCLGMSISDLSKQGRTASIPMSLKQTEELWMCIQSCEQRSVYYVAIEWH